MFLKKHFDVAFSPDLCVSKIPESKKWFGATGLSVCMCNYMLNISLYIFKTNKDKYKKFLYKLLVKCMDKLYRFWWNQKLEVGLGEPEVSILKTDLTIFIY